MELKILCSIESMKIDSLVQKKIGEVNIHEREVDVCIRNYYITPANEVDTGGFISLVTQTG